MKGKLQSVPKVTPLNLPNSGTSAAATAVPVSSSGATSSVAPISVLQVSMLRVDRHHIEPEPEPIRRHPVANWRPYPGPTEEKHPCSLLTMPDSKITILLHMAGQHFEHIVFGANQYACWLRCTQCEAVPHQESIIGLLYVRNQQTTAVDLIHAGADGGELDAAQAEKEDEAVDDNNTTIEQYPVYCDHSVLVDDKGHVLNEYRTMVHCPFCEQQALAGSPVEWRSRKLHAFTTACSIRT